MAVRGTIMPIGLARLIVTGTILLIVTIMLDSVSSKLFVPEFFVGIQRSVLLKFTTSSDLSVSIGRVGCETAPAPKEKYVKF